MYYAKYLGDPAPIFANQFIIASAWQVIASRTIIIKKNTIKNQEKETAKTTANTKRHPVKQTQSRTLVEVDKIHGMSPNSRFIRCSSAK
jgi:hypothetical protein